MVESERVNQSESGGHSTSVYGIVGYMESHHLFGISKEITCHATCITQHVTVSVPLVFLFIIIDLFLKYVINFDPLNSYICQWNFLNAVQNNPAGGVIINGRLRVYKHKRENSQEVGFLS